MNATTTLQPQTQGTPTPPAEARGEAAWPIVAMREIVVRLTDRNFLISTAVTLAIIVGSLAFSATMGGRATTITVAVTAPAAAQLVDEVAVAARAADENAAVSSVLATDDGAARKLVTDGAADAYLHSNGGEWTLTNKSAPDQRLALYVREVVMQDAMQRNAAAAGTSIGALQGGATLRVDSIERSGDPAGEMVRMFTGLVFAMLFYMASLMFGMAIASSVVEEKQSRIVEILATAIPVRQLLVGKILGNTLLALGQMVLFVGAGLIGVSFTEYKKYLPSLTGPAGWYLVFFLAGFVALACVWAVAGSLASRNEDLQSTTTPLTMILVVALFAGLGASGIWQTVGSYVPVVSTIVMPMRLLDGSAAWAEALTSLVITLVFAALTILVGEKLYRRSLLQTGGRVSLRQALKATD